MRRDCSLSIAVLGFSFASLAPGQTLTPPKPGDNTVVVVPAQPPTGYTATLTPHVGCAVGEVALGAPVAVPSPIAPGRPVLVPLAATLSVGAPVCVVESYVPEPGSGPPPAETTSASAIAAVPAPAVVAPAPSAVAPLAHNQRRS
jgi:hypothetical protein